MYVDIAKLQRLVLSTSQQDEAIVRHEYASDADKLTTSHMPMTQLATTTYRNTVNADSC
jgi:hypothetical protein